MDKKTFQEIKGCQELIYSNSQNTDNVFRKVKGFVEELQFRRKQAKDYEQQVLQCFEEKHALESKLKDEVKIKKDLKDEYECKIKWLKEQRDQDFESLKHQQDKNKLRVESLVIDVDMYQEELKKLQLENLDLDIRLRNAENRYTLHVYQRDNIEQQLANCKQAQEKLFAKCQQYFQELVIQKDLFVKATTSRDKIEEAFNQQAEILTWFKSNQNKLVEETIALKKELKGDIENIIVRKDDREAETLRKELAEKMKDILHLNEKVLELTRESARNFAFVNKISAQLKRSVKAQNIAEKQIKNMEEETQAAVKELKNAKEQLKNEQELMLVPRDKNLKVSYLEKGTQTLFEEVVLISDSETNLIETQYQQPLSQEVKKENCEVQIELAKPPEETDIYQDNGYEFEEAPITSENVPNRSQVDVGNSNFPECFLEEVTPPLPQEGPDPIEIAKPSNPVFEPIGNIEVPSLVDEFSQEVSNDLGISKDKVKPSTLLTKDNETSDSILKQLEVPTVCDGIPIKYIKLEEYHECKDNSETNKASASFKVLEVPSSVEVEPSNLENVNHIVPNAAVEPLINRDLSKQSTPLSKDIDSVSKQTVEKTNEDVKGAKETDEMKLSIQIGIKNDVQKDCAMSISEKVNQMTSDTTSKEPQVSKSLVKTENFSYNITDNASSTGTEPVLALENPVSATETFSNERKASDSDGVEIRRQFSDDVEVVKVVFDNIIPVIKKAEKQDGNNEPMRTNSVESKFRFGLVSTANLSPSPMGIPLDSKATSKKIVTSSEVTNMANFRKLGESSLVSGTSFFVPFKAFSSLHPARRKLSFESPYKKPKID